jgi:hypothetical protein
MKKLIHSAIGTFTLMFASSVIAAPPITQNLTLNVVEEGEGFTTFTFNQFNPSLGTLNAVDLIIDSSTLQGNFTVFKSTSRTFSSLTASLLLPSVPGYGSGDYSTSLFAFARTPSGTFSVNNNTQLVSVNGTTQSLIGGSAITLSINPASFSAYTGLSSISFDSTIVIAANSGGSFTLNGANLLSPTSLTLQYSYTPGTAPVPEPGQVAASLLLLGGIGAYVFIKRRKKSAPAAA